MSLIFTKIFIFLWLLFFILLIFLDRESNYTKIGLIVFLLILTLITVLRTLESKKEWNEIVKDLKDDEKEVFK